MIATLTEVDFMAQVTELAEIRGWQWVHWRAGRFDTGWRVPVQGPLGKGWPDLFLVRERDGRRLAMELKRDKAVATEAQKEVVRLFNACGIEALIVRPQDWPFIMEVLT